MIGFALPWLLGVAVACALAISALHLLSVRRPPELMLPTARFLPERDVRAVSRTRKPSDVLLLAVRIAALLAAGLAAAMPTWTSRARERVVMVVADRGVKHDTVAMRALVQEAGASSRVVFVEAVDSANAGRVHDAAALMPIAWRAASQLSQRDASVDSIDLHLLLSTAPAHDVGLIAWRAAWPGRVVTHHPASVDVDRRVVVVDAGNAKARAETSGGAGNAAADDARPSRANDDAVRAAFAWHAARVSRADAATVDTVVLSRGDATPDVDASRASSGLVVLWPSSGVPATWRATAGAKGGPADSASAIAVAGRALIGPFPVTALAPDDALSSGKPDTVSAISWWSDGRVAATELRTTERCERSVALVSEPGSDILLSSSANTLFDRLLAPCERRAPIDASLLTMTDVKAGALADAEQFRGTNESHAARSSWIVPMLFALSLILLVAEWRLRMRALAGAA